LHAEADLPFLEVYVETPLDVAEERDPKGLYKKARAGEIKGFTGIDDPYEEPESAELVLHTAQQTIEESVRALLDLIESQGLLKA
jgi:adenylylsulfate kinase